ncbi:hypothetical protein [Streptomyces sp. NBC_01207]|uniref:hypothetical protein n=1 Tax=Streptomyces sp. NBC_01207 TaxID=2903772 RepID=UPI002E0D2D8A|nr:hypothetical protein OG457_03015 [Streptomyces sp. NBC_01207]
MTREGSQLLDRAIAEWDMFFEEPSAEAPPLEQLLGWAWPEWVTAPLNGWR